jgi:hypothetical protein
MPRIDQETEDFVSSLIDEVHEYQREYLMQGLYVTARDLEFYL